MRMFEVHLCCCTTAQIQPTCGKLDLVWLIDSSGSINDDNNTNYALVLNFVRNVTQKFMIGTNMTNVALLTYSRETRIEWYLDQGYDRDTVLDNILKVRYQGGDTNIAKGLANATDKVFVTARGDRDGVPNVALIVSDGKGTLDTERTIPEANRMKTEKGVYVIGVGIGSSVDGELLSIISSYNRMVMAEFPTLGTIVEIVVNYTCKQNPPVVPDIVPCKFKPFREAQEQLITTGSIFKKKGSGKRNGKVSLLEGGCLG